MLVRIVYVIGGCGVSGGNAVVCQHANRLLARGHAVWLVAEDGGDSIDWFPNNKVPVLDLRQYPADVDVLVATFWPTAYRIAHLPAKRKFYFVQSDETRFHEPGSAHEHLARLSYLFEYRYLTEARWIQQWLRASFGHESQLVPNGLDEELFHPAKPLEPRTAKPRVLIEGAIAVPWKGMSEAFAAVAPLDVEVWCVSVEGRPKKGWRCDRFFERVPIGQMKHIYSSCDVLLKLSRVEGFFGPPMEMMACGGTVVVGRVTGHDEYIVDGENALVVDPFDVDGARAAVQRLVSDPSLGDRLRRNGMATARAWPWNKSVDILEAHYASVLERPSGRAATGSGEINRSIAAMYTYATGNDLSMMASNRGTSEAAQRIAHALLRRGWFQRLSQLGWAGYRRWGKVGRWLAARSKRRGKPDLAPSQ